MLWICGFFAVLLVLNYVTESIPIRFVSDAPSHSDFSVMCYNVKCSDEDYQENQSDIANEIIAESPDVVFLCEFNRSVSKGLDSLMREWGRYKSYYKSGTNCIFYSKYDIDSIAGIDTETSSGKKALNNRVHVTTMNGMVTIVGCHLSSSRKDFWSGKKNRAKEVDSIYQGIKEETYPVIMMGDMNDVSGSYAINRLKEAGLKDAWWEGGCGYGATFHGKGLRLRIDHILYDYEGIELTGVKVIDSDLSDHNALIARFRIKNDNE